MFSSIPGRKFVLLLVAEVTTVAKLEVVHLKADVFELEFDEDEAVEIGEDCSRLVGGNPAEVIKDKFEGDIGQDKLMPWLFPV